MQSLLGVHGTVLKWFSSYLIGRTSSVSINQHSCDSARSSFGFPQGSVLGPLLFTIYTMPLSSIIKHHGLTYHFYADDTQIYLGFKAQHQSSFDEATRKTEQCILSIKRWMSVNMLKLNDEKTEFLIITSPYYKQHLEFHDIIVDQTTVNASSSARNIGVIFDNSMNMKDHISAVCKTCHFHLRNIGLIRKFLSQDACSTLVHSLISSRLDYCNSLLANLPKSSLTPLQRVQNTAARIITRTSKYDHITPVLYSLHWLPIKQRIMFKILTLVFRCIKDMAPIYLSALISLKKSTYKTRSSDHITLQYATPLTSYAARSFSTYGPMLFNALPTYIRVLDSCRKIKSSLKTFLFNAAFKPEQLPQCSIFL